VKLFETSTGEGGEEIKTLKEGINFDKLTVIEEKSCLPLIISRYNPWAYLPKVWMNGMDDRSTMI